MRNFKELFKLVPSLQDHNTKILIMQAFAKLVCMIRKCCKKMERYLFRFVDAVRQGDSRILNFFNSNHELITSVNISHFFDDYALETASDVNNIYIYFKKGGQLIETVTIPKVNDTDTFLQSIRPDTSVTNKYDFVLNNNTVVGSITFPEDTNYYPTDFTINGREITLTLNNGHTFNVTVPEPKLPGYYFSPVTLTTSSLDRNWSKLEYIGVDLVKHPDNDSNHRYVYRIENGNPTKIEEYQIMVLDYVYFVSTGMTNGTSESEFEFLIPYGEIAYLTYGAINDGFDFYLKKTGIIEGKRYFDKYGNFITPLDSTGETYINDYKNIMSVSKPVIIKSNGSSVEEGDIRVGKIYRTGNQDLYTREDGGTWTQRTLADSNTVDDYSVRVFGYNPFKVLKNNGYQNFEGEIESRNISLRGKNPAIMDFVKCSNYDNNDLTNLYRKINNQSSIYVYDPVDNGLHEITNIASRYKYIIAVPIENFTKVTAAPAGAPSTTEPVIDLPLTPETNTEELFVGTFNGFGIDPLTSTGEEVSTDPFTGAEYRPPLLKRDYNKRCRCYITLASTTESSDPRYMPSFNDVSRPLNTYCIPMLYAGSIPVGGDKVVTNAPLSYIKANNYWEYPRQTDTSSLVPNVTTLASKRTWLDNGTFNATAMLSILEYYLALCLSHNTKTVPDGISNVYSRYNIRCGWTNKWGTYTFDGNDVNLRFDMYVSQNPIENNETLANVKLEMFYVCSSQSANNIISAHMTFNCNIGSYIRNWVTGTDTKQYILYAQGATQATKLQGYINAMPQVTLNSAVGIVKYIDNNLITELLVDWSSENN